MLSGALTEADFFHQKKHAYATSMQKRGFSTERQSATAQRVADVVTGEAKLAAKAGETYKFHLTLTRMQAIFAEKPEVHRLFLAKVPHEMSEKAFWTAYLRKQEKKKLEQQAKAEAATLERQSAAGGADAAAGAAGSTYDVLGLEGSSAHDAPERKRKRYPDASVDREEGAAFERHQGRFGVVVNDDESHHQRVADGARASERRTRDLMKQVNKHGEVVLDGLGAAARIGSVDAAADAGEARAEAARRRAWVAIPDLEAPPAPAHLRLPSARARRPRRRARQRRRLRRRQRRRRGGARGGARRAAERLPPARDVARRGGGAGDRRGAGGRRGRARRGGARQDGARGGGGRGGAPPRVRRRAPRRR